MEMNIQIIPGILPFNPLGPGCACLKIALGDFVSALPKRWINVTAPVWAV